MINYQSCGECRHWMCVNYTHNAGVCTKHLDLPIKTGSDPGCMDYGRSVSKMKESDYYEMKAKLSSLYGEVLKNGS